MMIRPIQNLSLEVMKKICYYNQQNRHESIEDRLHN